ncbi:hypothetical protein NE237_018529 [Protea cynaroides]|uniref:Phosphatidylinositol-specific phospholipase C X domain-containing protein n=1 Tax=Protea cynaroides TaxID=273540 RepID=A0A9Q0KA56_9MAGN|nr:hypothetical protein NE237_018529 [Protea cynaroides]
MASIISKLKELDDLPQKVDSEISNLEKHEKAVKSEAKTLEDLQQKSGNRFPGSDYHPSDRKNWMNGLDPQKIPINKIIWPGTHDSATNEIGIPDITRPFAQCQSLSIYDQLVLGTRVLDIRVQEDRRVCHGILLSYNIDVVINDIKKFLSETSSEIIILEIRTEFGHDDPPEFDNYLVGELSDFLIHQDDRVFDMTVAELLPKRVICVWKPSKSAPPKSGDPLWSSAYLKDNWIDNDLPWTKFQSNMKYLSEQPPVSNRKFFYRVENTVTPQANYPDVVIKSVTWRIHPYARLFISQCLSKDYVDRLQIFSTDFIDEDFVDACIGFTFAKIEGKA